MSAQSVDPYWELTARRGPFPLTEQVVDGRPVQVFDRSPRTLVEAFLEMRAHGDAEALVYLDERWTYAEQDRLVMALARQLRDRFGVGRGDRVAVAMRNYPEWGPVFWAVQLLGGVVVPLNAWLTGYELQGLLADSEPVVLIADQERLGRVAGRPEGLAGLRGVIVVRGRHPAAVPFEDVVADVDGPDVEPHPVTPDDVATILYTSGTTGAPKGVLATHRNHVSTILVMRLRAEAVRRARLADAGGPATPTATLVTNPLFHIAALTALTSNAYAGRRVVLMYKWDAEEALRLIERERVSEMSGPPLVVRQLVDGAARGEHDTSSLVSLVVGAAPAPPQLIQDIGTTFGGAVSPGTGYGSTETTSTVLTITGADYLARPTSVGRPVPTVEMRVRASDGAIVPPCGVGELEIRGPQVAVGYHHRPEATADAFADGWYRTGDQVSVDADGFVHLVGRLKDVVIRGGENVYCAEVESAIENHADVLEAAVIGIAHPLWGEEVGAFVRLRPGRSLDPGELTAFLVERLAAFKVPTAVRFTDDPLPRTASGKVVKADLTIGTPVMGA
ncbi:class I adenylate-forming enzyme family protein [Blastococcus sp. URHD0036]|uniref:class I adenylate-forming enzyme family protein n=1 Tax=Blastococcus sp. URHD0036 TaxID=1380356 RepID=UPI00055000CF|nr:class I adenylate-forming enzyme family protein [Blastococcus sp. URHD0036]